MQVRQPPEAIRHGAVCAAAGCAALWVAPWPANGPALFAFAAFLALVVAARWGRLLTSDVADGLFAFVALAGLATLTPPLFAILILTAGLLLSLGHRRWRLGLPALATHIIAGAAAYGLYIATGAVLATDLPVVQATIISIVAAAAGLLALTGLTLTVGTRGATAEYAGRTIAEQVVVFGAFTGLGILTAIAWRAAPALLPATALPVALIGRFLDDATGGALQRLDRRTKLPNGATFKARATAELARGLRFSRPAGLVVVALTASSGRLSTTDLQRVAALLRLISRAYDLVGYLGKGRFAILLPETDEEETRAFAGRLRARIDELRAASAVDATPLPALVHLGIALHPRHGDTARALLAAATVDMARSIAGTTPPNQSDIATGRAAPRPTDQQEPARAAEPAAVAEQAPAAKRGFQPPAWAVTAYICGVWLAAGILFAATLQPIPRADWALFAALGLLGIAARTLHIELYGRGSISTHIVILIAGVLLLGPTGTMPLGALVALSRWRWKKRPRIYIFDAGMNALVTGLLALSAPWLAAFLPDSTWHLPLALRGLLIGGLAYALNIGLLIVVMALDEGGSPFALWRERFDWLLPLYLAFGVLAIFMAWATTSLGLAALIVFSVPAFMLRLVQKQYVDRTKEHVAALRETHAQLAAANTQLTDSLAELERSYSATLNAFSGMLDARDQETEGHCERVVAYATAIGRALGLPAEELSTLAVGALLHDIGKVGVADAILHKPGPLTPQEWVEMRRHPVIGYGMMAAIPFLQAAAPIVRHHHERWDGTGYPDRLGGEDIPLAARIFAVADAFDAMISDRPYRRGLPPEEALRRIAADAGTHFDPVVAKTILALAETENWSTQARAAAARHLPSSLFLTQLA